MTVASVMPILADLYRQKSVGLFTQQDGKLLHEREPSFRKWTACQGGAPSQELVSGLRDVLAAVGLASYIMRAESWCLQSGAAFLSELIEDEDTFADFWNTLTGCSDMSRFGELKQAMIRRVRTDSSSEGENEERDDISWNSFSPQQAAQLWQQQEDEEMCAASHEQIEFMSYQWECSNRNNDIPDPTGSYIANANVDNFGSKINPDCQDIDLDLYSHYHSQLEQDMRLAFARNLSPDEQDAIVSAFNGDGANFGVISHEELVHIVQTFGFEWNDTEAVHVKSSDEAFAGQIDTGVGSQAGYVEFGPFCALMTFKTIKHLQHQRPSMQVPLERRW